MSTHKLIICSFIFLLVTACSANKTNEWFVSRNGNMPSEERIAQVSVGDNQDKVLKILGAPSSVVSLDKNTWLYMSSDIKRVAFFAPSEIKRDVLTIRFDDKGKVTEISRLDKDCGEDVEINDDKTEAPGEKLGFFRKFFGGVGQYNPLGGVGNNL